MEDHAVPREISFLPEQIQYRIYCSTLGRFRVRVEGPFRTPFPWLNGQDQNNPDNRCNQCGRKVIDQCTNTHFPRGLRVELSQGRNNAWNDQRQNQHFKNTYENWARKIYVSNVFRSNPTSVDSFVYDRTDRCNTFLSFSSMIRCYTWFAFDSSKGDSDDNTQKHRDNGCNQQGLFFETLFSAALLAAIFLRCNRQIFFGWKWYYRSSKEDYFRSWLFSWIGRRGCDQGCHYGRRLAFEEFHELTRSARVDLRQTKRCSITYDLRSMRWWFVGFAFILHLKLLETRRSQSIIILNKD